MGTTPTLGLPWPDPSDLVQNVDDDIHDLATAVEAAIVGITPASKMVAGRFYRPNWNIASAASWAGAGVASGAYVPWLARRTGTIDRAGVNVTTAGAAGSVFRLGLFADANGIPGARIVDWGTVPSTAVGVSFLSGLTTPIVYGTLYWVYVANQVAAAQATAINGGWNPDHPIGDPGIATAERGTFEQNQAGALPAASGLIATSAAGVRGWVPYLRVA